MRRTDKPPLPTCQANRTTASKHFHKVVHLFIACRSQLVVLDEENDEQDEHIYITSFSERNITHGIDMLPLKIATASKKLELIS